MGLYSIITRATGTVLTGAGSSSNIFNVDHQNHVIHTEPMSVNSWEDTQAHMDLETNPVNADGTLSLPSAMSDELQRLRFTLTTLKGAISGSTPPHWYTPTGTFSAFVNLPPVACRLEATTPLNFVNNTTESLTWIVPGAVVYDTSAGKTMAPSSAGIVDGITAPVSGVYIVGGTLTFAAAADGTFQLTLSKKPVGSTTLTPLATNEHFFSTATFKGLTVETIYKFAANEIVRLTMLQTSITSQTAAEDASHAKPALWMALIGR